MFEHKFYLKQYNYSVFKNKFTYYIYIYNKNFFLLIKINQKLTLKILNSKEFKLSSHNNYIFQIFPKMEQFLKQFEKYNFAKIKFAGKGYKIKKNKKNSMILVFNKAHISVIWWKNIILKKIKKSKFYIKYTIKNTHFIKTILNVRYVNIFTKKGLRLSRQILLKKKGKKI